MTDLSLTALTSELMRLSRALDEAQADLVKCEDEAARARHRADLAEARAYVAASGAVELRKRDAFIASEDHKLDADVADAALKAARSRIQVLRTRIDVGRTLISSARAEMTFAGMS